MRLEKLRALFAAKVVTAAVNGLVFGNIALALWVQNHFFHPSGTGGADIFFTAPEEERIKQKDKKVGQNKEKEKSEEQRYDLSSPIRIRS